MTVASQVGWTEKTMAEEKGVVMVVSTVVWMV